MVNTIFSELGFFDEKPIMFLKTDTVILCLD